MRRRIFQVASLPGLLPAMLIILAGWWVYHPVLRGDWLWDDDILITDNHLKHDPAAFWKIWFHPGVLIDYYPITFSLQRLEWDLWGMNTLGYHVVNLVLHLVNALLVWRLLAKLGLRLAWLGGLIFAIHPVNVESVAWIAELKNTLSLPLLLLAMCAWIDYADRKGARHYWLALVLFLAAILCKTTVVMLPVVILLYTWWKSGRIGWNDLKDAAPFFLLALAFGLLSASLNSTRLITADHGPYIPLGGFLSRLACTGILISVYFTHFFLPWDLTPVYTHWTLDPPTPRLFLPLLVLVGGIAWLWKKRHSWGRHALLGFGFFLINIGPFCGFFWAPHMQLTWIMDHFLYIPCIGLIGLVVAGLEQARATLAPAARLGALGIFSAVLAALAWLSHSYAALFINQQTLWTYTIRHNPACWLAHNNLGLVFMKNGQIPAAMQQYEEALQIDGNLTYSRVNLANALAQEGHLQEALDQYGLALKIQPGNAWIENYIGNALTAAGRVDEAVAAYREALRIDPNNVDAHNDLGLMLTQSGQAPEGIAQYREAARLDPDYALAHYNLGIALGQAGQMREAVAEFQRAAALNPDDAKTHYNLAVALIALGQRPEALDQTEAALKIDPHYAAAQRLVAELRGQAVRP